MTRAGFPADPKAARWGWVHSWLVPCIARATDTASISQPTSRSGVFHRIPPSTRPNTHDVCFHCSFNPEASRPGVVGQLAACLFAVRWCLAGSTVALHVSFPWSTASPAEAMQLAECLFLFFSNCCAVEVCVLTLSGLPPAIAHDVPFMYPL